LIITFDPGLTLRVLNNIYFGIAYPFHQFASRHPSNDFANLASADVTFFQRLHLNLVPNFRRSTVRYLRAVNPFHHSVCRSDFGG
jgi:hypothetical protein